MEKKINADLHIEGTRVLLVGFRGNKNMGDELILIGNLKLLLAQGKEPVVVAQDPDFLRTFCAQFIDVSKVEFIYELPRGIRSAFAYFKKPFWKGFSHYYRCDAIVLGGGEIITEENKNAYRYWYIPMRAVFFNPKIKLYVMGGIQVPKSAFNLFLFRYLEKRAEAFYLRDFEEIKTFTPRELKQVDFFMDTSYFIEQDWGKWRTNSEKYIVINLNKNGEKFFDEMLPLVKSYAEQGYEIYYVPVCKGCDPDIAFYDRFLKAGIDKKQLKMLDWEQDFWGFLQILANAEKVIATRLHLFLVASYLGVPVQVFPYQKKIGKMQKVLQEFGILKKE